MNRTIQPLHDAAKTGNIEQLKQLLLEDNTMIDSTNRARQTAVLIAAMNKEYETVQFLIEQGANLNLQDETCLNPFLWGCLQNDLTLVRMMVKAGVNLDVTTRFGGVGITPAAEKGYVEIVKELLETTEINVNHTNTVGWTPLLEAIVLNDGGQKQQEIIRLLLEYGANPNMSDKYGKTPLTLAKEKGYAQIAAILQEAGGIE